MGVYETGDDKSRFTVVERIRYDTETGRLLGFDQGNGIRTRYSYDAQGVLKTMTRKRGGDIVHRDRYDWADNGLLSSIESLEAVNSRRFEYDGSGRLILEEHGGNLAGGQSVAYAYDAVGNRLSRDDSGTSHAYAFAPDSNRLVERNRSSVEYDERGHMISDRGRTFDYDASGRMSAFYRGGIRLRRPWPPRAQAASSR